jgi:hypothetical protein
MLRLKRMSVPVTVDNHEPTTIRVLIASMPPLLAEIVAQAIHSQPDMVLLGRTQGFPGLLFEAGQQVDVLLLTAESLYPPPVMCRDLLKAFPHLRMLVMTPSADRAVLYWLGPRRRRMKTLSTSALLRNIRQIYALDAVTFQ